MGDLDGLDIRHAPIEELGGARDWSTPERDFWADEAAMWERFTGLWEGLNDAAWQAPLETIRGQAAWGWSFMVVHGHQLDHLGLLEPWIAARRSRN